jgi:serine/threonine-protein kinase
MRDASAPRRPVEIGEVLGGKYLVEEVLGEGGAGVVVAAHHLELDEKVALKFLRADVMHDPDVVARFAHEAKAAVTIKCEYVARVFDVGVTPGGAPFFVMEHLEGHDLAVELLHRGSLAVKDAVECAMQVCEALAVAHAKGIIHRDIKPENLFLVDRGDGIPVIKVLDFGISKATLRGSIFGSSLPNLDKTRVLGTPFYMSPEQIRCTDNVDARTDIWSLGMVLYELLTGQPGFVGDSINAVCTTILNEPLPPLASRRADLPPGLVTVIERCLEKDADKRFPNVAELSLALLQFAPKRARLCAERACNALRAAGVTTRVVSTMPPPSSQPARFDLRVVEQIRRAADLRESDPAVTGPSSESVASPIPGPIAPVAPRPKGRKSLLVAGVATIVVLGALFAARAIRGTSAAKAPAAPSVEQSAPSVGQPAPSVGQPATLDPSP